MPGYLPHDCPQMRTFIEDSRLPIGYTDRFREYWIELVAGHRALQVIEFCPWCGAELPRSLRDEYFDALEPLEVDIGTAVDELPAEYRDDTWWRRLESP
ncbi:hypothetical protein KM427_05585 [Nocardioides sp. LMS-CY]|uniref:DUF6980 domain-containing protein n=1 Tax=Nocardioides soli TaxID=1036020 RepID=A0A7W4VXH9_9ACTN|nr:MULTISPECIES: hypothetical protein [Nocardioides]MBB3043122.1 hypothetical protein [Nocardioides soli]QWF23194.1 hypothetical protein KM427_05585 [Nocardioides sp. LMS-CY]